MSKKLDKIADEYLAALVANGKATKKQADAIKAKAGRTRAVT